MSFLKPQGLLVAMVKIRIWLRIRKPPASIVSTLKRGSGYLRTRGNTLSAPQLTRKSWLPVQANPMGFSLAF